MVRNKTPDRNQVSKELKIRAEGVNKNTISSQRSMNAIKYIRMGLGLIAIILVILIYFKLS